MFLWGYELDVLFVDQLLLPKEDRFGAEANSLKSLHP